MQRILRDQLTSSFKTIWVDNEEAFESVLRFVQRFQPALVNRVKLYTRTNPIFDEFNITAELEKALRPKVWLKSGGYIVINQTEALVAIDVNTGKYVGKSNRLEDTIVRVNTDAIKEIVRQIRLRDLGGIIAEAGRSGCACYQVSTPHESQVERANRPKPPWARFVVAHRS